MLWVCLLCLLACYRDSDSDSVVRGDEDATFKANENFSQVSLGSSRPTETRTMCRSTPYDSAHGSSP